MQNQNTKINFLVGLFVLGGIIALLFLALQAANLSSFSTSKSYEVTCLLYTSPSPRDRG